MYERFWVGRSSGRWKERMEIWWEKDVIWEESSDGEHSRGKKMFERFWVGRESGSCTCGVESMKRERIMYER